MLVNTQYFRENALYFKKHNVYPHGIKDSAEYISWWAEETNRCLYGYSVGGMWIPGYYYYYLNYCPIQIVEATKGKKASGNRKLDFPKFWDVDYIFFMSCHIARYGIPNQYLESQEKINEYFDSLPINLNIKRSKENLEGGKHIIWLKARGVGASFKGGSMASRNYHLVKKSKSYMFADQKEYLTKDGIYSKFIEYMDWININAPEFREYHDVKGDRNNMHFINNYKDGDIVDGLHSEMLGTIVANDPDKGRGKRGMLALFEEAGRFGSLDQTWNIFRNSVEEGGIVYGLMIAYGTGGTEGADFQSMQKMFYSPKAYNVLVFDNIYDTGLQGTDCALFTPAYMNIQHTDDQGNSNIEEGKNYLDKIYKEALDSIDPTLIIRRKAELPTSPADAMMNTNVNKFATATLLDWRNKLVGEGKDKYGTPVQLYKTAEGKIESIYNHSGLDNYHPPIVNYPHDQKQDLHGSVVIYSRPYLVDGEVPENLYVIGHDPYADDYAEDKTSLGAAYVIMNKNNLIPNDTGNRIVAEWVGRPDTTDEYNEILFMLAEMYNAKIGFENDRGDVVGFAKRKKLVNLLAPEFELAWDEQIKVKTPNSRKFGMRSGRGKNNPVVLLGNTYIAEWLLENRGEDTAGRVLYNVHLIRSLALLDELKMYNPLGNFDRISALRVGMYYIRDLIYRGKFPSKKKTNKKSFSKFLRTERFV